MSRSISHLRLPQLRGNQFHRCEHTSDDSHEATQALQLLLESAGTKGIKEQRLLDWFGTSTARIALLAHASGRPPPKYIARELIFNGMRADFALLEVPKSSDIPPRLVLVEFQGALPNSLFESRGRTLLYWGRDFLDGFSQLMDWHFFRYHAPMGQKVASLIADCRRPVETTFLLVAGLQEYSKDELSERRLAWWSSTLSLGAGFRVVRFDDISREARHWLESCGKWKPDGPPAVPVTASKENRRPASGTAGPRNNKAALAGRPHAVSMAGAGAGA